MSDVSYICGYHAFADFLRDPNSNPYQWAFLFCHMVAILVFAVSSATGNMSQVDKLWSLLPTIYAWMCVVDSRTKLMAALSTLWSIRLTYNFYRRGGYTWPPWQGDEDYRWECLRRGMLGGFWKVFTNEWIWVIFNIFFISLFQNYLLLLITSPSLMAWSLAMKRLHCPIGEGGDHVVEHSSSLNILDGLATILFITFLLLETEADNQQAKFQSEKQVWRSTIRNSDGFANAIKIATLQTSLSECKDGFCEFLHILDLNRILVTKTPLNFAMAMVTGQSGLFAIVRKPAYACEQGIWISYYLFSVAAGYSQSDHTWNWSCSGFILLCLLFQGSGWLTEQISISKYTAYRAYKEKVPLYLPKLSTLWNLIMGINREVCNKMD